MTYFLQKKVGKTSNWKKFRKFPYLNCIRSRITPSRSRMMMQ